MSVRKTYERKSSSRSGFSKLRTETKAKDKAAAKAAAKPQAPPKPKAPPKPPVDPCAEGHANTVDKRSGITRNAPSGIQYPGNIVHRVSQYKMTCKRCGYSAGWQTDDCFTFTVDRLPWAQQEKLQKTGEDFD